MPETPKADDSRQSVNLKWKLRKALEENISPSDDGLIINGSLLTKDGKHIATQLFQHTVVIIGTSLKVSFTAISENNLPIDSLQDLANVFGGKVLSVNGLAVVSGTVMCAFKLSVSNTASSSIITSLTWGSSIVQSTSTLGTLGANSVSDDVTTLNNGEQ